MGQLEFKPKKGQAPTRVVNGNDGSVFIFKAGLPVDEGEVPEGVRAVLSELSGVTIEAADPEPKPEAEAGRKRGGN